MQVINQLPWMNQEPPRLVFHLLLPWSIHVHYKLMLLVVVVEKRNNKYTNLVLGVTQDATEQTAVRKLQFDGVQNQEPL